MIELNLTNPLRRETIHIFSLSHVPITEYIAIYYDCIIQNIISHHTFHSVNPSPKNGAGNLFGLFRHMGQKLFLILDDLIHIIKFHRSPDSIGNALCKWRPRWRIPLPNLCSWIAMSNSFPESPRNAISPPEDRLINWN